MSDGSVRRFARGPWGRDAPGPSKPICPHSLSPAAAHAMTYSGVRLPLARWRVLAVFLAGIACAAPGSYAAGSSAAGSSAAGSWVKDPADFPSSPLCRPEEVTLWTCTARRKTFSLCAQRDAPMDHVAIQVRVRDRSGKIVLRYPQPLRAPRSAFAYECSANGDAEVEFKIGRTTYSLVDPLRDTSFISVMKGQRELAHLSCHEGNQSLQLNDTIALMRALKVPAPNGGR